MDPFTNSMQSVSRQYATAAGVEVDDDGKAAHIDVPNKGGKGKPVDLENVGVPSDKEKVDPEALAPEGAPEANPDVDGATDPVTREPVEGEDA